MSPRPGDPSDDDVTWARYEAARRWIDVDLVRPGKRRLDLEGKARAARAFFASLGDPQRAFAAVQVAGTSGKGSVSSAIARVLDAAGLRAGLHVSPYLQAFTEKMQAGGRLAHGLEMARAVDVVRPAIEALHDDGSLPASVHGLAGLGAVFEVLRRADLELAVVETGVGGRFDLIQGLRRALSVISDLGLDHQDVLGPTLDSIAWHKAGVLEQGVPAVAVQGPGWAVIEAEARRLDVDLTPVRPDEVALDLGGGRALLRLPRLGDVEVALPAVPFQRRNAALAGVALDRLAALGWPVRAEHVAAGLSGLRCPGRFEVVDAARPVILDGAHNAQKAAALRDALRAALGGEARATVVLATTGGRDPRDVLRALSPITRRVIATAPPLHGKEVAGPAELAAAARSEGLLAEHEPDPERAVVQALEGDDGPVLITGSLYLVGRARERWYPAREVVLQRTSWPT